MSGSWLVALYLSYGRGAGRGASCLNVTGPRPQDPEIDTVAEPQGLNHLVLSERNKGKKRKKNMKKIQVHLSM